MSMHNSHYQKPLPELARFNSTSLVLLALLLQAAMVGCGGAAERTELGPVQPDPKSQQLHDEQSMLALCEAIIEGDESVAPQIRSHPLVHKMSKGMKPQVTFTPEEFATAAFSLQADEKFSFARLRKNAIYVQPFGQHVAQNRDDLISETINRATEFLAVDIEPSAVTLNLVCGSPWDAFVLIFETPEVFFDLGHYASAELDQALPGFQAVLTHELWHLAFLEHQQTRWPLQYRQHEEPVELFMYRVLNEGVAHYYSMRHKLYPTVSIDDFADRTSAAFAALERNYPRYLSEKDAETRRDILWHSHAGVPFWEKWGAIPGALIIYYLEGEIGKQGIAELIEQEPFSIFLAYANHAASKPNWPKLPSRLVEDAGHALKRHHEAVSHVEAQASE